MDERIKHLEMIQGVINRMSSNSFLLKGWTVVLISALFVLGTTSNKSAAFFYLAYFPGIVFWLLDGFYLWQEKLYRNLYDEVRTAEGPVNFGMKTDEHSENYLKTVGSKTTAGFHVPLLLTIFVVSTIS